MAFPTPGTVKSTSFATSVTSMAVNYPASTTSGDLLVAISGVRNSGTWSTIPSGWSQLVAPFAAGGVGDMTVFTKTASGTEGGTTATWVASVATTASWLTVDISGWDGTTTPEFATKNSGGTPSTNSFNAVTPASGADNYLWLALYVTTANGTTASAAPTNYLGFVTNSVSSGGSQVGASFAYRQLNASSETPGSFTTSADRWWMTTTLAIKPSGGSTPTAHNLTLLGVGT